MQIDTYKSNHPYNCAIGFYIIQKKEDCFKLYFLTLLFIQ